MRRSPLWADRRRLVESLHPALCHQLCTSGASSGQGLVREADERAYIGLIRDLRVAGTRIPDLLRVLTDLRVAPIVFESCKRPDTVHCDHVLADDA